MPNVYKVSHSSTAFKEGVINENNWESEMDLAKILLGLCKGTRSLSEGNRAGSFYQLSSA